MNSINKSPTLNPIARQEIYISPRLYSMNKTCSIDSSDESSMTLSDTNSISIFSSNDSLSSFEDYKKDNNCGFISSTDKYIGPIFSCKDYKKDNNKVNLANCNRGFISSVCCSFCKRD